MELNTYFSQNVHHTVLTQFIVWNNKLALQLIHHMYVYVIKTRMTVTILPWHQIKLKIRLRLIIMTLLMLPYYFTKKYYSRGLSSWLHT